MNEKSKFELERLYDSYKFYIELITKGIWFSLFIDGALLKFAIDDLENKRYFALAGILFYFALLPLFLYLPFLTKKFHKEFEKLGSLTGTKIFNITPLRILWITVFIVWLLIIIGWCCLYAS